MTMRNGRPLLLDTFCKAGGASMGYHRAGFEVIGVDIEPQKNYPFEFHQGDAIEFIAKCGREFDVIHASPPCQAYGPTVTLSGGNHPRLVEPTRQALKATGRPYIIENVVGAPLVNPIMLCGTMFGILEVRHRIFECEPTVWWPPGQSNHHRPIVKLGHRPIRTKHFPQITGHFSDVEWAREIRNAHWMTRDELAQSFPPAYTEWLGGQMLKAFGLKKADADLQEAR